MVEWRGKASVVGPFESQVSIFLADRGTREVVLKVKGEIGATKQ
jgi:hypothetical protein